jgi:hypothetical protein
MVVAKEHLCLAACLEIAAKRLGITVVDQVAIANLVGVTVPSESDASTLANDGVTQVNIDPDPRNWGIREGADGLNEAFELAQIPMTVKFHPISRFQDWEFEERLATLSGAARYPIVGFDYNTLFGDLVRGEQGHCCVVFEAGDPVKLYDPGPVRAGFSSVNIFDLYRACRKKPGGFWVLQEL